MQSTMADQRDALSHPMQPLGLDAHDVIRFKGNAIVRAVYEVAREHGYGLNEIAQGDFSDEDRQQFAQLLGYSLSGYAELTDYVSDEAYAAAEAAAGADAIQRQREAWYAKDPRPNPNELQQRERP
jgi:hypothetical protein